MRTLGESTDNEGESIALPIHSTAGKLERRFGRLVSVLTAAIALSVVVFVSVRDVIAFEDVDQDGIDDGLEAELAARFLPELRYQWSELCHFPESNPVLFRARHPKKNGQAYTDYIAISYVRLYAQDCGPVGHAGDNEPFLVFLRWYGGDWHFEWNSAVAHMGTGCEVRTWGYEPRLWIGENKHGTYADYYQCVSGEFCHNECSEIGFHRQHTLYNVGERYAWMLNELGDIDAQFSGEKVWNDETPPWDPKFLDAGKIANQLSFTALPILTEPPGYDPYACSQQCWADYLACQESGQDISICAFIEHNCQISCQFANSWDPD
jgi:hypothetical protein